VFVDLDLRAHSGVVLYHPDHVQVEEGQGVRVLPADAGVFRPDRCTTPSPRRVSPPNLGGVRVLSVLSADVRVCRDSARP
jgi:hypothetical protein